MWYWLSHTYVNVMAENCWKSTCIRSEEDNAQFTGHSIGNPSVIQVCIWMKFHP